MNKSTIDPHVYPGTNVLINKFDIKIQDDLNLIETTYFRKRLEEGIPQGGFDYEHYKSLHRHIFQDVYEWAGIERTVAISKGESFFAVPERITPCMITILNGLKKENYLKNYDQNEFSKKAAHYFNELNAVHPFREGNGRTLRLFFDEVADKVGFSLNWEKVDRGFYIKASIDGFEGSGNLMVQLFSDITQSHDKNISKRHGLRNGFNVEKNITTDFLSKILKYIDAVEQYEIVLKKIYEEGVTQIKSELTNELKEYKQSIINLAQQIHENAIWESIQQNVIVTYPAKYTNNLHEIKADIIDGRVTNQTLNTLYNHVKAKINSNRKDKSIGYSQKK